jgi:hypothetical protein
MTMNDTKLQERIDGLGEDADFTDPNTYMELLGYNAEGAEGGQGSEDASASQQQADTAQAPAAAPAAPAQAESSAPAAAAEPTAEPNVDGVLTRDGKHFMPFRVLETARQSAASERQARELAEAAAREANERAQALQAELDARNAGQDDAAADTAISDGIDDARLAELETDFPEVAAQVKLTRALAAEVQNLRKQVAQAPAAAAAPAQDDTAARQSIQDEIDRHPLLAQWQAKGGRAWQEAVQLDNELRNDPAWKGKSAAERFGHVQKTLADEFGIPIPAAAPAPALTSAAPTQPAAPTQQPAVRDAALPTLTDFSGTPTATAKGMEGMSTIDMMNAAQGMTEEQLRALAGLSY